MVGVEKWKEHFCRQAHRTFPKEKMHIVNQTGHGLGRNAYSRQAMYKVRCTSGPNCSVEIVSPIAQSLNRAKYMLKGNGGRTKHKTKGPIKRKARSHSGSHKGGSQRRKMSKRKKNKTKKRKSKKKKGKSRWSTAYVSKCVKTKGKKKRH